ncbi:Leucine-rich repeat protein of unknown function [endosymbiont DhMRE of Dentiscutata heterogama]|uniref:leucine-rich repeat domain-containing protein n=1 Tax=endosymbiont DhMRE of Dentiscutata heterogama TaxID=1609546 RepID=UPI000629D935|nr:hypothetical protein [endosymbiont DhMRE of Dentiscutata heterogama]CFW93430.1 Leucine-rich repeat protein of unknown function [endosymbiont DhMRE of Dentiscutata heterogama]
MSTLQEYLNQKYPTKKDKEQVKEIIIEDKSYYDTDLEETIDDNPWEKIDGGELDLSDYSNLKKININEKCLNSPLTKLELGAKPKLSSLSLSVEQLTDLKFNNCSNLKELYCSGNRLTNLDLTGLINLEKLSCANNQLNNLHLNNHPHLKHVKCDKNEITSLIINDCPNLEIIECEHNRIPELNVSSCPELKELCCGNNLLTDLEFTNNLKLEKLEISNNKFTERDLNFLSHLVNLKELYLSNNGIVGSLKYLQNMVELGVLFVNDTDIDSGLEYLPESVYELYCEATNEEEDAKIKVINQELRNYGWWNWGSQAHLLKGWKEKHHEKVNPIKVIQQAQLIERLEAKLVTERENNQSKVVELEEEKHQFQEQLQQLFSIVFPIQSYSFLALQAEIQRIKTQDLVTQISLKKQELEELTNLLKDNLSVSGKYLLEKLLKKQKKVLQNNDNASEKIEELKQTLSAELSNDQESLQTLLNKQTEIHQLEKHLVSLQNQQQTAQILQSTNS